MFVIMTLILMKMVGILNFLLKCCCNIFEILYTYSLAIFCTKFLFMLVNLLHNFCYYISFAFFANILLFAATFFNSAQTKLIDL